MKHSKSLIRELCILNVLCNAITDKSQEIRRMLNDISNNCKDSNNHKKCNNYNDKINVQLADVCSDLKDINELLETPKMIIANTADSVIDGFAGDNKQ